MGNDNSSAKKYHSDSVKDELHEVTGKLKANLGGVEVSGRYHSLPRKLEDDYELQGDVLGEGYNGAVSLAKCKRTGVKYAVKPFKLHNMGQESLIELRNEVEVFLSMDHPHIARLRDVYECKDVLQLVMECLEGGELFDRIATKKRFTEKDAADATYQMLLAVNYIHSKDIVHRDIKLENFLYDTKDGDHLKLIDFGFSRTYKAGVDKRMEASCGTLSYMAPEVLENNHKGYDHKVDLWSLGVVVFILLMGYMPFGGTRDDKNLRAIKAGDYTVKKKPWARLSESARNMITSLLCVDKFKRVTASEALKLPFIENRDKADDVVDDGIVNSLLEFSQATHFKRTCLSMMAWSLSNDERSAVRKAFVEMDSEKTGILRLHDIKTVLQANVKVDDAQVKKIFDSLDANHNEEVNYSDFLAAMMSSRIAMHDDLIISAFARFDTDNSGYITPANLRDLLSVRLEGQNADEMIAEADIDKDGRISPEEFAMFIRGESATEMQKEAAAQIVEQELALQGSTGRRKADENDRMADEKAQPQPAESKKEAAAVKEAAGKDKPPASEKKSKTCSIL